MPITSPILEADLDRLKKLILKLVKLNRWVRIDVNYDPAKGRVFWTVIQKNISEDDIS